MRITAVKYYLPADYDDFQCLKGACRHTCCAGWEIDVDEDTARLYEELPGPAGELARASLYRNGDTLSFRLDASGRCPMLQEDGLCSLICAFGEDALCNICADHPRYRSFFSDRVETGLGLCCEAAARQTVYRKTPYRLVLVEDDGEEAPLTEAEQEVLSMRARFADILERDALSYERKEAETESLLPPFSRPSCRDAAAFLQGLERLDPAWDERLQILSAGGRAHPASLSRDRALSQLAVSFLYRHLPGAAEDGQPAVRTVFALWAVRLIGAITETDSLDDLAESARMFSAEIEYSEENLAACLAYVKSRFRAE